MNLLSVNKRPLQLLLACLLMGSIHILLATFSLRWDVTQDHRYTLHPLTKTLVKTLQEPLTCSVYLTGKLPAGFQQLQEATDSFLKSIQNLAPHHINYRFVEADSLPKSDMKILMKKMKLFGLQPTNLLIERRGERVQKQLFPFLFLNYRGQERGVLLLKSSEYASVSSEAMLGQSIENVEHHVMSALQGLVQEKKPSVALITSHGAPAITQLQGMIKELKRNFNFSPIALTDTAPLSGYAAVILIRPQQPLSEAEKYTLDQYLMRGGKLLIFMNALKVDLNHLKQGIEFATELDTGLSDLLFRYGVRVNPDLVEDIQCGAYPVIVGQLGNKPNIQLLPWPFFPIINHYPAHLIVKNLDALYMQFVNSLSPIAVADVKATPLLYSSPYSRTRTTPIIDLEELKENLKKERFQGGPFPLAYLLEGQFTSRYLHRPIPAEHDKSSFVAKSSATRLIVVGSSNVPLNAHKKNNLAPLPWGYDPYIQHTFAHKDFVMNALAYLIDPSGVITLKQKSMMLRPLNKVFIFQYGYFIQWVALFIPLLLLALVSWGLQVRYRRKYGR